MNKWCVCSWENSKSCSKEMNNFPPFCWWWSQWLLFLWSLWTNRVFWTFRHCYSAQDVSSTLSSPHNKSFGVKLSEFGPATCGEYCKRFQVIRKKPRSLDGFIERFLQTYTNILWYPVWFRQFNWRKCDWIVVASFQEVHCYWYWYDHQNIHKFSGDFHLIVISFLFPFFPSLPNRCKFAWLEGILAKRNISLKIA